MGAKLISDDQTHFMLKENQIIISKPKTTPNFIEARGIGLIEVPFVVSAKLFCFVKITNLELKTFKLQKNIALEKIKMMNLILL